MSKVTIDFARIDGMAQEAAENGVRSALGEAEHILKGDILSRPGTGRNYGRHTASAPGQPPAPDTGALRANTSADPILRQDGEDTVGRIVANSAQAEALEKGTEKMAPRPFLGLLASDHADQMRAAFTRGAKRGQG